VSDVSVSVGDYRHVLFPMIVIDVRIRSVSTIGHFHLFGSESLTGVVDSVVSSAGWRELHNVEVGREMTVPLRLILHHPIRN
jgi:hypothetical protein